MDAATEPIRADSFYVFTEEAITRDVLASKNNFPIKCFLINSRLRAGDFTRGWKFAC